MILNKPLPICLSSYFTLQIVQPPTALYISRGVPIRGVRVMARISIHILTYDTYLDTFIFGDLLTSCDLSLFWEITNIPRLCLEFMLSLSGGVIHNINLR